MQKTSLKATKQQQHSPSKVEIVLSDKEKLSYAPMVALVAKAYGYELESENLTQLKGKANFEFAMNFVNIVRDNELSYASYMALKKHTIQSIATAKHIQFDSVEKWFNPIIKSYIKNDLSDGYELPKSESKNAEAMSKLRNALASIDTDKLNAEIEASAKAGDFKRASQLSSEKLKREKQEKNALVKSYKQNVSALKKQIKDKITKVDNELQLAALMWAVNNVNEVVKMAKITK